MERLWYSHTSEPHNGDSLHTPSRISSSSYLRPHSQDMLHTIASIPNRCACSVSGHRIHLNSCCTFGDNALNFGEVYSHSMRNHCICFPQFFRQSGFFLDCSIVFDKLQFFLISFCRLFRLSGLFRTETGHFHPFMLEPQASRLGEAFIHEKRTSLSTGSSVCVGITYLPGQSPAKYCRRT